MMQLVLRVHIYRKLYDLLDSGTTVIHQTYEREIPASLGCRFVRLLKHDLYSFRRQMLYYRLMFLLYRNGKYLLVDTRLPVIQPVHTEKRNGWLLAVDSLWKWSFSVLFPTSPGTAQLRSGDSFFMVSFSMGTAFSQKSRSNLKVSL